MSGPPEAAVPNRKADLAIALIALIWGSTFVIVKDALQDISVFLFLSLRFTLASVILAVVLRGRVWRRARGTQNRSWWRGGLLCGFLLFLGYALQTAGLSRTTASKSAFITGLYIVLVPLLGSFVNRNRPRWAELAGAAAATLGTALMSLNNLELSLNPGDLLTVACAVAFAMHILAVAHYSRKIDYEKLSLLQVAGVALFSWMALGVLEEARVVWSTRVWVALLVTAILATALSFVLYTWAQRNTTATRAVLIFALEPVFAGLTGWLAAGESWTIQSLTGAGLILSGIVLVEMKPPRIAEHQQL